VGNYIPAAMTMSIILLEEEAHQVPAITTAMAATLIDTRTRDREEISRHSDKDLTSNSKDPRTSSRKTFSKISLESRDKEGCNNNNLARSPMEWGSSSNSLNK